MFCKQCGAELTDEAVVCPKCGCATDNYKDVPKANDDDDIFMFILSLLIPLLGFILWIVWRKDCPLRAGSCAHGAFTGLVLGIFLSIILGAMGFSCLRLLA